jgi:hypothetical protein
VFYVYEQGEQGLNFIIVKDLFTYKHVNQKRTKKCQMCTVRKMGLILRSIERMLKMQFSMARKFTLQPLRRYDVKPPKKPAEAESSV